MYPYSILDLKKRLKITGTSAIKENPNSNENDVQLKASEELVILYKVLPAWMAINEGGATLKL